MSHCEKIKYAKIKKACIKNLHAKNISSCDFKSKTGEIETLTVNTINGQSIDCLSNQRNIQGKITPVQYINGKPQQPAKPVNFNPRVLDELWFLNQLSSTFTNLDAAYGRLRNVILSGFYDCLICPEPELKNCNCPIPDYAVFRGSISNNVLTVTEILDISYTTCPPVKGTIKLGQRLYGKPNKFLNTIITGQISGEEGGIGTYSVINNFDENIDVDEEDMLSLTDVATEECASIPLKIYGVETLSVGPTGGCDTLMSSLNYNINIANKSLGTKVAAIYVQVGWEDLITEEINIQGLVIDTKQFDYSILSFGEQMNNNITLPSDLTNIIYKFNVTGVVNSVVQLVLFMEDGLEVFFPESGTSSSVSRKDINTKAVTTNTNNYSASFNPSSYLTTGTGKVEPYIQPNIGQSVDLTYSNISNQDLLSAPNSITVNGNEWYMINSVTQNTINVLNIGYSENSSVGTNIGSPGDMVVTDYVAYTILDGFVQPEPNQTTRNFTIWNFKNTDIPYMLGNKGGTVYVVGGVSDIPGGTPVNKFAGIYNVTRAEPTSLSSIYQWFLDLQLLPGQLNVPAGKYINSPTLYILGNLR